VAMEKKRQSRGRRHARWGLLRPQRCCIALLALLAAASTLLSAALCIGSAKEDELIIICQYLAYRIYVFYAQLRAALFGHVIDTSWDGQAEFLANDAEERKISPGWVVDIGAHDGIWLSNSFFFVQRGFSALLVEAAPETYRRLTGNLQSWAGTARTCLAAVGVRDGELVRMVKSGWLDGTTNHVESDACHSWDLTCVNTISLPRLLLSHGVPSEFFLLSLDVEWGQDQYLRMIVDMLRANFTPSYIIAENVHDADATDVMTWLGYEWIEHFRYDAVFRRKAPPPGHAARTPIAADHGLLGSCSHISWPLQAESLQPVERVLRDFHARRRLLAATSLSEEMDAAFETMLEVACNADMLVLEKEVTDQVLKSCTWLMNAGEQLQGTVVRRYEGTWKHPYSEGEQITWAVLTWQLHERATEQREIILTAFPVVSDGAKAAELIDYLQHRSIEIRTLGLQDAASNSLLAYAKEYNAKHTSLFEAKQWVRQLQEVGRIDLEFSALCSTIGVEKPLPGFYRQQSVRILFQLAGCYEQLGNTSVQVAILERVVPKYVQTYGAHHYQLIPVLNSLGSAYQKLGKPAKQRHLSEWLSRIPVPMARSRKKGR